MTPSSDNSGLLLREHDYIGLSEVPSAAPAKTSPSGSEYLGLHLGLGLEIGLGLELGLGLGSGFGSEEASADGKSVHAINESNKKNCSVKRGYSEAIAMPVKTPNSQQKPSFLPSWVPSPLTKQEEVAERASDDDYTPPPPSKDRVVGWPPVRSYRRQTLTKPVEMFVKVNMDGIAVGRKLDLNAYSSYEGLLHALEDMFQPSNNTAQGASLALCGRERHFLLSDESDFVLTYEDKDGDWMLVGDVPWSMFVSTVRRLRITRGAESNNPGKSHAAASRGTEKVRFHV